jgi:hypothetical protein
MGACFEGVAARLWPVMRRTPLAPRTGGLSTSLRRILPVFAVGAALALAGCSTQSPVQTDEPYQPADGVPVDLGPVQVRDLVVISSGKGKPGVLSASLINTSDTEHRVAFALPESTPVFATAPPHSQHELSNGTQLQLPSVPVVPGEVVVLTVQSPAAPTTVVTVPVLPPVGYYATLDARAAPTPEASPTTTATP